MTLLAEAALGLLVLVLFVAGVYLGYRIGVESIRLDLMISESFGSLDLTPEDEDPATCSCPYRDRETGAW